MVVHNEACVGQLTRQRQQLSISAPMAPCRLVAKRDWIREHNRCAALNVLQKDAMHEPIATLLTEANNGDIPVKFRISVSRRQWRGIQ